MTTKGSDTPPVAVQAVGLVADGLASALARFVGPLDHDRTAAAAAGPTPPPAPAEPAGDARAGPGMTRRAALVPAAAATDLVGKVVSGLVPAVLRSIDLNEILERVDVEALVRRLGLNEIVEQVDVDRVLDSVDPNRLLDRVDVDELVRRIDMGPVAREALEGIGMGELIRESTATIGQDTVEAVRVRAMHVDAGVARVVDRVLRRSRPRDTELEGPETTP